MTRYPDIYSNALADLAEVTGMQLRLEYDDEAPQLYAVWCTAPDCDEDDQDIIGSGDTSTDAIAEAEKQLREWEMLPTDQEKLDALAKKHGVQLRLEYLEYPDDPTLGAWAVWLNDAFTGVENILATGSTSADAIEEARTKLESP